MADALSFLTAVLTRLRRAPRGQGPLPSLIPFTLWHGVAVGLAGFAISLLVLPLMLWLDPLMQAKAVVWPRFLVRIFQYITEIGRSGWTLWPVGLFIVLTLYRFYKGVGHFADKVMIALSLRLWFIFFSVAGSGLIGSLVKNSLGRARPSAIDIEGWLSFHPFAFKAIYASFPSGHAITSMATATALWLLWPRYRFVWLIIGFLGAFSRVVVNAHYLSDVVAGSLWGIAFTLLAWQGFAKRALVFAPDGRPLPFPSRRGVEALKTAGKISL